MLLEKFPLPELHTSFSFESMIEQIQPWKDILKFISDSKVNYDTAVKTGVYK